jgi:GH25 family lysozyme M1 (1,4-beta-N-acetylmuramidase)
MKKAIGQFLLLICILIASGCNANTSNFGASFIFQNFKSLEQFDVIFNDNQSAPQIQEAFDFNAHRNHFVEITDVEEENEERASSQEKLSSHTFFVLFFNTDVAKHLSNKLQKNILSFEANCVMVSFKHYLHFQVYRI